MPSFPEGGRKNGWIADDFYKDVVGTHGMKQVNGTDDEDLFIFGDQDELIKQEVVLFLKLHSGYPVPIRISMWTTVFGFFLESKEKQSVMVCTIGLLQHVLHNKASLIRGWKEKKLEQNLLVRYKQAGGNVHLWKLGTPGHYAGWHCSWCMDVEGIRIKLNSAINGDFPRWGNYPEKCKPDYIKSLIRRAMWFDEKSRFHRLPPSHPDPNPPFHMMANRARFPYMFGNVYLSETNTTFRHLSNKTNH